MEIAKADGNEIPDDNAGAAINAMWKMLSLSMSGEDIRPLLAEAERNNPTGAGLVSRFVGWDLPI